MTLPVRWGVLGAGWLVTTATADAIHAADGAVLAATAARDLDRARATEPLRAYDSYAAVIDDPEVDAVYICLANDAHLPWIQAATAAGKHVLCEKPLTLSRALADEAFACGERHGVMVVEATWTRWHPRMRRIVDLATSGALGTLTAYEGSFTFEGVTPGNYRLSLAHGGGALYDVGIYPLHGLLACLPEVDALDVLEVERAMNGTHDDAVDLTTRAQVSWGPGTSASILASFATPAQQRLRLTGTDGSLEVLGEDAFANWRKPARLRVGDHVEEFPATDAYALMFAGMSAAIQGQGGWVLPARDSLRVASAVDSLLW